MYIKYYQQLAPDVNLCNAAIVGGTVGGIVGGLVLMGIIVTVVGCVLKRKREVLIK